jgi:transposase
MIASGLTRCSPPSSSSARPRHIGEANICAPTRATAARSTFAPSRITATSLTSSIGARRLTSSNKKARRWVVEVCHSWFNRFRKLLVRYEKLERSFMALNHLAAAIIAFRKVPADVNVIYG